jgi:hypothetical protein
VTPNPVDISEAREMVKKLAMIIRASERLEWNAGEMAEFYKTYPAYKAKFKMSLVETYGQEFGLNYAKNTLKLTSKTSTTTATTATAKPPSPISKASPAPPLQSAPEMKQPQSTPKTPPAPTPAATSSSPLPDGRVMVQQLARLMNSAGRKQLLSHEIALFIKPILNIID